MTATTYSSIGFGDPDRRLIARWLLCVAALVAIMVLVGGATRLTGSGLSMTDWKPISGVLPPLNDEQWAREFANYKQSPEYQKINRGMSLAAFKDIFYWEWGHRLLGRLIGLAFALPLVFFWLRRRIPAGYHGRLIALLILGGMQGLLGWYMVQSGLVDRPSVSHYRLAAHLSLALFLLACLVWTALDLLRPKPVGAPAGLRRWIIAAAVVLPLQLVLGALVAGLDAGLAANDWPTMLGQLVPVGLLEYQPVWLNLVENPLTLQFEHRLLGYGFAAVVIALVLQAGRAPAAIARIIWLLAALTGLQILLGIVTVMLSVPVWAGVAHQAGGVALLITTVVLVHDSRRRTGRVG